MTPDEGREHLSGLLDDPHAAALVSRYFSYDQFAGSLFDEQGDNPPNEITGDDLLAVSLLDVRFSPRAVRALLATDGERGSESVASQATALLAQLPTQVALWDCTEDALTTAGRLWRLIDNVPTLGATRTSKLLARKRPHLLPITDTVVLRQLPLPSNNYRASLRDVFRDHSVCDRIEQLRPQNVHVSLLRLLDVLLWMQGSQSRAVK